MGAKHIEIDVTKQFEHLPKAPIVEAVIHWRARADKTLDPATLQAGLEKNLPDYPNLKPRHAELLQMKVGPTETSAKHSATWDGFRLETEDKKQIAQFTKDGFIFSRLEPYQDWERFVNEATRLWIIHSELTKPSEVQRLGVRFINAIRPVPAKKLSSILSLPPKSPAKMGLPICGFMHQSVFGVPGHTYNIQVVQTIQPASLPDAEGDTLIVDIDVYTTKHLPCENLILSQHLEEMRVLKDEVFFSLIKEKALDRFRE